jgi:ABC-type transporter Mla MlaB component
MTAALRITLTGHLTRSSLGVVLKSIEPRMKRESRLLIVDCRSLSGYDADARALFVEWNARHREQIRAVALVSDNNFFSVVVSAMALASRQRMKVFHDEPTALAWANAES